MLLLPCKGNEGDENQSVKSFCHRSLIPLSWILPPKK